MGMVVQETMMNDKVVGLILKQSDYKDASAIVTVLTQRFGKIGLVANGIRKPKSKNAGRLIPYTKAEFSIDYHENRTLFTLKSVSTLAVYKNMHMDLERSMCAAVMSEVCDAFVMRGVESEYFSDFFSDLDTAFQLLEKNGDICTILALFLVNAMYYYGIAPDVDECVHCGKKYVSAISSKDGGFLCVDCANKANIPARDMHDLKRFRLLVKGGLKQYDRIIKEQHAKMMDVRILIDMIYQHTGMKIRSFALFERLFVIE